MPKQQKSLKKILKDRGWTYRSAATKMDVTYQYLSDVLNGNRKSIRLCSRITKIPHATKLQ